MTITSSSKYAQPSPEIDEEPCQRGPTRRSRAGGFWPAKLIHARQLNFQIHKRHGIASVICTTERSG